MEAPPGIEPGMEVLQTSALPLGDGALWSSSHGPSPREEPQILESTSGVQSGSMAAARRMLPIVALLAVACGRAEFTRAEAGRIIQERLFPKGTIAEIVTFQEGPQCLKRDNDFRVHVLEALERLGYVQASKGQPIRFGSERATVQSDPLRPFVRIGRTSS